jgi:hypothetical protein
MRAHTCTESAYKSHYLFDNTWNCPIYASYGAGLEKIAPEDVPQNFKDYIRSRQSAAAA